MQTLNNNTQLNTLISETHMSKKTSATIYLISDSTGDTVASIAHAALAQFADVEIDEQYKNLIKTPKQLENALKAVEEKPGPVLYTLIEPEMRARLKQKCRELHVPCISVIGRVIRELSRYLGIKSAIGPHTLPLNDKYFNKIDALDYTLAHDDGQKYTLLQYADVILIGVSRTSKTPTSVYLAFKGYKTANVPYVLESQNYLDECLQTLPKNILIVGLTIDVDRLVDIRKNRLLQIDGDNKTGYVDLESVKQEVASSKRFLHKHKIPIIDITRRSVEETAARIVQLYQKHHNNTLKKQT